jgi:tubulin polyglutamylase TTLL1
MKHMATMAVKATYNKVDPAPKMFTFELFGLDFIVDDQFSPWLIEINTNPCLELSSPVLERLIPELMENVFRVAVDPVFQATEESSRARSFLLY